MELIFNKPGTFYDADYCFQVLKKYYPGGFAGYDPSSCPVWLIPFGGADMRGDFDSKNSFPFYSFVVDVK